MAIPVLAQTAADPSRPATDVTNTPRQDRDTDHNYGWIGLLGLAGLGGLMRRQHSHDHAVNTRQTSPNRI